MIDITHEQIVKAIRANSLGTRCYLVSGFLGTISTVSATLIDLWPPQ